MRAASTSPARPRVLLSFDVEEFDLPGEYGAVPAFETQIAVGAEGLAAVLDLLDRLRLPATFFTTAVFARECPALLARIAGGHELASHGWSHSSFADDDLERSRIELQRLSGRPVHGFRRARFGAFDRRRLAAAGYTYDSSDNPIWLPGRYNNLGKPRLPYRADGLVILPVSASPLVRFPLFWLAFKHVPPALFRAASRWTLGHDGHLNLFFHPWEFADLGRFGLPKLVARPDGAAMVARLERYLLWLRERADFETLGAFAERLRA
jgi:hypothetical protein